MSRIIELEDTNKHCPFDNSILQKIIYFSRQYDLDSDENGDDLKDRCVCMSCGYEVLFLSAVARQDIIDDVNESLPNKAELFDAKEQMREGRKNRMRIRIKGGGGGG